MGPIGSFGCPSKIAASSQSPESCWSNICHWGRQKKTQQLMSDSYVPGTYSVLFNYTPTVLWNVVTASLSFRRGGDRSSNKQSLLCCPSYQPVQVLLSFESSLLFAFLVPPSPSFPFLLFSTSFSFLFHFIFTLKILSQALCFRVTATPCLLWMWLVYLWIFESLPWHISLMLLILDP